MVYFSELSEYREKGNLEHDHTTNRKLAQTLQHEKWQQFGRLIGHDNGSITAAIWNHYRRLFGQAIT